MALIVGLRGLRFACRLYGSAVGFQILVGISISEVGSQCVVSDIVVFEIEFGLSDLHVAHVG